MLLGRVQVSNVYSLVWTHGRDFFLHLFHDMAWCGVSCHAASPGCRSWVLQRSVGESVRRVLPWARSQEGGSTAWPEVSCASLLASNTKRRVASRSDVVRCLSPKRGLTRGAGGVTRRRGARHSRRLDLAAPTLSCWQCHVSCATGRWARTGR